MSAKCPRAPAELAIVIGMGYRMTGFSAFGLGVEWEKVPGDEKVAHRVIAYLENRRLLFGSRHSKDQDHCVASAIEIRNYLTTELGLTKQGSSLSMSLRAIRAACRQFVEAGGPRGRNFLGDAPWDAGPFGLALGDLRTLVGWQVATIAGEYEIEVEPELAAIMPPSLDSDEDDPSWLPGFEDQT